MSNAYHKVFVYGSLLTDLNNHCVLTGHGGNLVGEGKTQELFTMRGFADTYPAITKRGQGHQIVGELYEVTPRGLQALDYLEGYNPDKKGGFYTREKVTIIVECYGEEFETPAWIYYIPQMNNRFHRTVPVDGGCWKTHLAWVEENRAELDAQAQANKRALAESVWFKTGASYNEGSY